MSIIDIKKDMMDNTKWNASTYHNANSGSVAKFLNRRFWCKNSGI
ncbi:hypothetical protein [Bacillus paranthracis]|nr:hypothetical protein [Bacillus paranthracis]ADY24754.1 hypothetical protein YBT020_27989 [Bacillus thuringiensis serovar finitimus YBT-020]MEC3358396.1 hypothetical protein [Bacillus paranthracis]MEC3361171.1 hypothetical protein [Bacillus paranthracis]MED1163942.1 hypothetical protein [Bacillus paranthracis]MED1248258.1 hypothetical protein [Bacillus paranthracis]